MDFSKALAELLEGQSVTLPKYNDNHIQYLEGGLWFVGRSGTRVRIEQLDVGDILSREWILL